MKKEKKIEKKLTLKKLQLVQLNTIRGGLGKNDGNDNGTNGDTTTTTSRNCQHGLDTAQ